MKGIIDILASGLRDRNGSLLSEGTVTVYDAGTTTLRSLYSDFDLSTALSNPFTLDDRGAKVAYTDTRVKLLIKDSLGRFVQVIDDVGIADSDVNATITGLSDITGAGLSLDSSTNKLSVNIDGTTITNSGGTLSVGIQGIGDDQLADEAVTYAKLIGHNIEESQGGSTINAPGLSGSTGYLQVEEFDTEITTIGRPVIIMLTPIVGAIDFGRVQYSAPSNRFYIALYRNGTQILQSVSRYSVGATTDVITMWLGGAFKMIDSPAAGDHTYTLKAMRSSSSAELSFKYLKLTVYEL